MIYYLYTDKIKLIKRRLTMKMTLARALAEIKLLNSKIEKNIGRLQLVATKTGKKDVIKLKRFINKKV